MAYFYMVDTSLAAPLTARSRRSIQDAVSRGLRQPEKQGVPPILKTEGVVSVVGELPARSDKSIAWKEKGNKEWQGANTSPKPNGSLMVWGAPSIDQ